MDGVARRLHVGKVYISFLYYSRQGKEQEASIAQIRFLGSTTSSSCIKDARGGAHVLTFLFLLLFTCHLDKPCTIERIHHITCAVFVRVAHTALMTHSCQHACDNLGRCKWAAFSDTATPNKRLGKKKHKDDLS